MPLTCPRCQRSLDYAGERPSFCAYCGQALGDTPGSASPPPSLTGADATTDFLHSRSTTFLHGVTGAAVVLPESVAGYRLVRKLGQGGMGSVHEAEDSASGRRVAVKLIAPEFTASATAVERFLQEGRLASAIAHPRCVFVLAADQADGWPYIVMELMPGHTLRDLVESGGPLPMGDAVHKIMDVIEGLEEAHKLGVIHRDVKPSNCFLDLEGRVKVGDFGLSKSLLGSDANLTRTGSFLGTPNYAAPEQIKGELTDARSDVYSVAATLYYLLAGKPPHEANDAAVALARIVSDDAPSIRTIRPEVWSALDQVVLRGLERDRKRRYRSLQEFREALSPFLPGRVALGRVGLRVGAYVVDMVILFLATSTSLLLFNWITLRLVLTLPTRRMIFPSLISGAVMLVYFGLLEVVGTRSLGKRIFNLRLISVTRGGPTQWREAIVRLLAFTVVVFVPWRVYLYILLRYPGAALGPRLSLETAFWLGSFPALFCTARPSNGYRGIHEILSGTGVLRIPGLSRRRSTRALFDANDAALHMGRPSGLPTAVGPFAIEGALVWTADRRILLGEDAGLGRPVWIVLRPPGLPLSSLARRDVGRIARPRWLNAGEIDGWGWEAFVAPIGRPLPDLSRSRRVLHWHQVRSMLEVLAAELDASCTDQTLSQHLALDRVWVQPDGRIFLLDEELDPFAGPAAEVVDADPQRRSLELLRQVAICGLSSRRPDDPSHPVAVGGPVPGHAIDVMDRLCGLTRPYDTVAEFRAELERTRDAPADLAYFQRIGHAAYSLVSRYVKTLLVPSLVAAFLVVVAFLAHEPVPLVSESVFDRILLFESVLWVLVAMLLREGIGGVIFGVTTVGADGRRPSRLRVAWREAVYWLPIIAADKVFELVPASGTLGFLRSYGTPAVVLLFPIVFVGHALIFSGRYLNDRFARTAVVPR